MSHHVWAIVTTLVLAVAVTVAHAAPLPIRAGNLLVLSRSVDIELPEAPGPPDVQVLVAGFGPGTAGQPLAPPWTIPTGSFAWTDDAAVGKPGGRNPGDNMAVIDVGRSSGIAVQATVVGLTDGPVGGDPTRVGLTVLADAEDHVLVLYERATGALSVSTSDTVLATQDVGSGRDVLTPLRVELGSNQLIVSLDGIVHVTIADLAAVIAPGTSHGVYVSRDNGARFTDFRIETLP